MSLPTDPPSSSRNSPYWDDEFNRLRWEEHQHQRLLQYEEKIARNILGHFNMTARAPSLAKDSETGTLRLRQILPLVPIPYFLVVSKPYYLHTVSLEDLHKRFTTTTLFQNFTEAAAAAEEDDYESEPLPVGMIFPWPGVSSAMIMYVGSGADEVDDFRISKVVRGNLFHIEQLRSFLRPFSL